jgi:hypothetical protein
MTHDVYVELPTEISDLESLIMEGSGGYDVTVKKNKIHIKSSNLKNLSIDDVWSLMEKGGDIKGVPVYAVIDASILDDTIPESVTGIPTNEQSCERLTWRKWKSNKYNKKSTMFFNKAKTRTWFPLTIAGDDFTIYDAKTIADLKTDKIKVLLEHELLDTIKNQDWPW